MERGDAGPIREVRVHGQGGVDDVADQTHPGRGPGRCRRGAQGSHRQQRRRSDEQAQRQQVRGGACDVLRRQTQRAQPGPTPDPEARQPRDQSDERRLRCRRRGQHPGAGGGGGQQHAEPARTLVRPQP